MEGGMRSGDHSGIVVKNRNSSGCLIVRKKGGGGVGGAGSSGSRKFELKNEKKRPRLVLSDSGSSDELLMPPRRRVDPATVRVCNGLTVYDKGIVDEGEIGRKSYRAENIRRNEDVLMGRSGDDQNDRKRNRLDVFEFDEYDGIDGENMRRRRFVDSEVEVGGRRYLGSMHMSRSSIEREYETGSSRHVVDKRKNLYFDRTSSLGRGDRADKNRFSMDRDGGQVPISLLREKFISDSDEPIRFQGKNGVLKVMVNKKKVSGSPKNHDPLEAKENPTTSRIENTSKRNVPFRSSFYSETKVLEKPNSFVRTEKNQMNLRKSLPIKKGKSCDLDSEDSDMSLKLGPKRVKACNATKGVTSEAEKTPCEKLPPTKIKEGKVRRGSGTEKQKLRERIRGMLLSAGWTIDYRPRRNRDYLDAVYINPAGTAYWSIIKAYDALQKQLNDDEAEAKTSKDGCSFTPIADDVLSQLTRKTRKKIEKEMRRKQKHGSDSENAEEAAAKKSSSTGHDEESMDSVSHEEKLSSFLRQGGRSLKSRMNENGVASVNSKNLTSRDSIEKPFSGSSSHLIQGRKSRKLGRCTLLVRSSNEGLNSENDGYTPYAGKRTLLSWLIDSGMVQLSQKVQYMNRRRTRVMLEGWITRDGIHCGCCSKILTVSKFEIHAGSKLRQPFQNIYLDSGVSLLQCQIDAWNRQEESERIGFLSVDIDGDDPNDDTCGICGDGGDLICCDGCPSTFHQSCLDIQMLPPGDWHCPNCTCKFCGIAGGDIAQGDDATVCALLACSLCEKKYHKSCIPEMDALPDDSYGSVPSFCGQKCRELFEYLQKYIGVKHELEAGFSWSLIRRTDADSETTLRGLPQRVECNSKLAVALTVMDECFLPIVDRRSGINLIHNVLYNCGSNFNRLNYGGFYTAILERGDEIISAASIRFHGTRLAEMPFIGTRHVYRRQGMCRRLFCAIESVLCSLKVEELIIPAIAELMHTWTVVFGFTTPEESLKREMRSMNMLVFPGIDMLQKLLLEQENIERNTSSAGAKQRELKAKHRIMPESASKSNMDLLAGHDPNDCDGLHHSDEINGESAAADSDSHSQDVPANDTSVMSGSLDASREKNPVSVNGTRCADSQSGGKLAESATIHDAVEMENKPVFDSPVENNMQSCKDGDVNDAHAVDVNFDTSHEVQIPTSVEGTLCCDSQSGIVLVKSASDGTCHFISDTSHDALEMKNKPVFDSLVEDNAHSCKEGDIDDALAVDVNVAASHDAKIPVSVEVAIHADSQLGGKLSHDDLEMENKLLLDLPVKDVTQSCKEIETDDAHTVDVNVPATVEKSSDSVEWTRCADSGDKLAEYASDKNFLSVTDTCHNALQMENKPISDTSVKDDTQSSGDTSTENTTEEVNENLDGSVPTFSVADVSSIEINSDPNNQFTLEKESKLYVASEAASKAMHCEESILHASCGSLGTDVHEGNTESSSI